MAWTRSMTRNQKTCRPWSDLNHDLLLLVMMRLGFGDYYTFRGVCKSWRLLAHSNKNKFMESRPPMSITISNDADEKVCCYLEEFEGRKFKTVLPNWLSGGGDCIGVTCGYLIFFTRKTRDFWLVNPVTRKQLHFPGLPFDYHPGPLNRAILVFSASISVWVFAVLYRGEIWFSIEVKGAWKHVSYTFHVVDLYAYKGKLYTSCYNSSYPIVHERHRLCELRLNPEPIFTLLETRNPLSSECFGVQMFVRSCDNLYVIDSKVKSYYELDVGEMKLVNPHEMRMEEYALFCSDLTNALVAVRRESWVDPRSHERYPETHNSGKIRRFFSAGMWYFPHQCMDVDCIEE